MSVAWPGPTSACSLTRHMTALPPTDPTPTGPAAAARRLPPAVRVLRPHQWVKNLLLLAPLVLAHVLPWAGGRAAEQWAHAALAFLAFCLTASAIYVLN